MRNIGAGGQNGLKSESQMCWVGTSSDQLAVPGMTAWVGTPLAAAPMSCKRMDKLAAHGWASGMLQSSCAFEAYLARPRTASVRVAASLAWLYFFS